MTTITTKETTKKTMTIEEAKKMEGTEFIYVFDDGDTIPAFVKKFDAEVGLTCMTLEAKTAMGWDDPSGTKELDGTFCVMGHDFSMHSLDGALADLAEIRETGRYRTTGDDRGYGDVSCSFL